MMQVLKSRIIFTFLLIILLYLFLSPEPLGFEIVLKPLWKYDITQLTSNDYTYIPANIGEPENTITTWNMIPFQKGNHFGFLTSEGRLIGSGTNGNELAISSDGFAFTSARNGSIEYIKPDGNDSISIAKSGFPFFIGNRKFIMRPDQSGIVEFNRQGKVLWEREFPSLITCLASGATITVIGFLDGHIQAFRNNGSLVIEYSHSGSRISAVYGVAISEDEQRIAVVSGLDKQRLSILEYRNKVFREIKSIPLNLELKRQIPCTFLDDGRLLAFERDGGLALFDIDVGKMDFRSTGIQITPFKMALGSRITFFAAQVESSVQFIGLGSTGTMTAALPLKGFKVGIYSESSSVYLSVDSSIFRMEMEIQ